MQTLFTNLPLATGNNQGMRVCMSSRGMEKHSLRRDKGQAPRWSAKDDLNRQRMKNAAFGFNAGALRKTGRVGRGGVGMSKSWEAGLANVPMQHTLPPA